MNYEVIYEWFLSMLTKLKIMQFTHLPIKVNVVSNNVKEATIPNKTIVVNNIIGAGDRPRNLGSGGKTLSLTS